MQNSFVTFFFIHIFDSSAAGNNANITLNVETFRYLKHEDKTSESMNIYPNVKKNLFLKYNT